MEQIKTMNINFPLQIELQDGQISKFHIQNVPIVCHSSRLIIDLTQLSEIHPLEANAIISTLACQLSASKLSDYIVLEGATEKKIEDLFSRIVNIGTSKVKDEVIQSISKGYPSTMKPLMCTYSIGYLPNPNKITDPVVKLTLFRKEYCAEGKNKNDINF